MNKETQLIQNYINSSGFYLDKIMKLRQKFGNSKDFFNGFGYIIMEILNEEKKFINLKRSNIDLPVLSHLYFGAENVTLK